MIGERMPLSSFRAAHALEEHADDIVEDYLRRLRALGSPLLAEPKACEGLESQARGVLEDTARSLCGPGDRPVPPGDGLSDRIGQLRAESSVHPSESLRAVSALTEAALSVLANVLPPSPTLREEVASAAVAIQRSIMDRVAQASIAYVDYLLRKVHEAYHDERWRIGRELHDEVAHSLAAVSQGLEVYEVLESRGDPGARAELSLAKDAVRDALRWVKGLSDELRSNGNGERIEAALSDLLSSGVPPRVQSWISVKGDESLLPPYVRDEMLLIVREAVRLAAGRRGVREIRVELRTTPTGATAVVADDGGSGDAESGPLVDRAALESMRERALLLRGTVKMYQEPGIGTRTEVTLPLARRDYRPRSEAAGSPPLTVLLADGHDRFRKSVAEVLTAGPTNVRVVGEARSGAEAVTLVGSEKPDVVLLDLELPIMGAKETIHKLMEASRTSRVVVLAMYEDPCLANELLTLGASAYVVKGASREELLSAVRAAARGEQSVVLSVPRAKPKRSKMPLEEHLSERQLEILTLAARGMSNRQIAGALHISEGTVKRHLANIYAKLRVSSRREAAEKALAEGLAL